MIGLGLGRKDKHMTILKKKNADGTVRKVLVTDGYSHAWAREEIVKLDKAITLRSSKEK